jgi:hypothetical protein
MSKTTCILIVAIGLGGCSAKSARSDAGAAGVTDARGATDVRPVDPADEALCHRMCDPTLTFDCPDQDCMAGCLRVFTAGVCLPENRLLIGCIADAGTSALTCLDGQTILRDGVCTIQISTASSCVLAASSGGDR